MTWHTMLHDLVGMRRSGNDFKANHLIRVFEKHVAEVQAAVPSGRLLTFDVAEGWSRSAGF